MAKLLGSGGIGGGNGGSGSGCRTSGGPAGAGVQCQFPFRHKGVLYNGCPVDPYEPNERWCSTKVDGQLEHVSGGGHYGFCSSDCPKHTDGSTTGSSGSQSQGIYKMFFNKVDKKLFYFIARLEHSLHGMQLCTLMCA